jgi:uncharacterized protein (DUF488 family)
LETDAARAGTILRENSMLKQILTIGVYGFTERAFYKALADARVDLFVDVRARRGLRGHEYAFANAARLQAGLKRRGIRYLHCKELAPSDHTRGLQAEADQAAHTARRKRSQLSPAFVKSYAAECLSRLNANALAAEELAGAARPVFFCVEGEPKACHRSLLAARLGKDLGLHISHLVP